MIQRILENNDLVLMEAAVVERLRRNEGIELHPTLVNAPLIYDHEGKNESEKIYREYIDIAKHNDKPIFICTPTWRANYSRVIESGINQNINIDAVQFLKSIRDKYGDFSTKIKIGGLIGCKNDCYLPEQGLSVTESMEFHSWQISQLVKGGADFLIAETLPNLDEAVGISKSLEKSGLPYFISFVIARNGNVLDGNSLSNSISTIDQNTKVNPTGYMINCAYPTFLCAENQPSEVLDRLIGYMGNASSLDHCELEDSKELHSEPISDWGSNMLILNRKYQIKALGGCCGTNSDYLNYLCDN